MSIESRSNQYGNVFEHWQIKELLGQGSGGKSAVFRLSRNDSSWGETCALKVMNLIEERGKLEDLPKFRKDEYISAMQECSQNAEQEVRLMANLRGNTNIVDYLDYKFVDWSDESSFGRDMLIRMEFLHDLRGELRNGKVFEEAEVIKLGRDICAALVLCHSKNILHRDIKPENIFVNKDGNYKLGDFGVSKIMSAAPMSMASTGIGTPEYAAPEQFSGKHDKRVDIYSLGLVLYELSNQNKLPFAASTYIRQEEVQKRQMGTPLPHPSNASNALTQVILKACAFKAEDRYQTAQEFLRALTILEGTDVPAAVSNTAGTYETMPAQNNAYATVPASTQTGEPAGYATSPAQENVNKNNDSTSKISTAKKKGKFITIIAGAVALIAILLAILPFINKDSSKDSTDTNSTGISSQENTLKDAEVLAQAGDYESAMRLLEEKQGSDEWNAEYEQAYNSYKTAHNDKIRNEAIAAAKEKADGGDNWGALQIINDAQLTIGEDGALQTAANTYTDAYVAEIVAESNALVEQREFEKAIKKVDKALEKLPDNAALEAQKAFIKDQEPVYLYDLQYTSYDNQGETSNVFEVINGTVTTYTGVEYNKGLVFYQYAHASRTLTYSLGGAYSKLTGSISMIETANTIGMNGKSTETGAVYVEFIGDGKALYKSPLTNRTIILDFIVDIQGVDVLEIRITPENETGYGSYGYWSYMAITECSLTKDPNYVTDTSRDETTNAKEPDSRLYDLQYTSYDNQGETSNVFEVINGTVTTYTGVEYNKGLVFYQYAHASRTLTYSLGGAYSKLTGSISMIETANTIGMNGKSTETGAVYVEFIGDGETIYKSPLTNRTVVLDFSVDIKDVGSLEIRIIPENETGYGSYGYWSYMAITGLELYK